MKLIVGAILCLLVACGPSTETTPAEDQIPVTESTTTTTSAPSTTTSEVSATPSSISTTLPVSTTTTTNLDDQTTLSILFIGNSHTSTHDIPAISEALLDSTGEIETDVHLLTASFLRSAAADAEIIESIQSGGWDVVVLQGQEISQSHTVAYSQDEAIALAREVISAGARPLFFAEWERRGIQETLYIEDIYNEMALESGAEVIPVGRSWDRFLETSPKHQLWAADGNHSSPDGAFLAAATIAYFILGPDAPLRSEPERFQLLDAAKSVIAEMEDG